MMSHKARVEVLPSLGKVGQALCGDLVRSAREDIASKGSFFCAVPGGSVLKLLGALKDTEGASAVDWRAVHLFYVNHKCVHGEDPSSTHLKAKKLFLGHFEGIRAHPITFSEAAAIGHDTVAHDYSKEIVRTLPLGVFDYMLLGVGKDGHIGALSFFMHTPLPPHTTNPDPHDYRPTQEASIRIARSSQRQAAR